MVDPKTQAAVERLTITLEHGDLIDGTTPSRLVQFHQVDVRTVLSALATQAERIKELEGALKPFAEVADWYDAREPDTFEVWLDYPHGFINRSVARLVNYRRARAALSATPPVAPPPAVAEQTEGEG